MAIENTTRLDHANQENQGASRPQEDSAHKNLIQRFRQGVEVVWNLARGQAEGVSKKRPLKVEPGFDISYGYTQVTVAGGKILSMEGPGVQALSLGMPVTVTERGHIDDGVPLGEPMTIVQLVDPVETGSFERLFGQLVTIADKNGRQRNIKPTRLVGFKEGVR